MKKLLSSIFIFMMCATLLTGCTQGESQEGGSSDGKITIEYPSNMKELGFEEPVVLDKMPEKVASLSTSPVLALDKLGVQFVAIPNSTVVTWPETLKDAKLLETGMHSNFDIETVVAMSPDLVILGYTTKDTYGKILESANIPVYYVDAGHTVSYESIKLLTTELINAFGANSEAGKEILKDFEDLEIRLEEQREKNKGRTVMVLQSAPPTHYIQTDGGTLGSMLEMMGFENVYESKEGSMIQLDFEQALSYDPDLFFATGRANTSEEFKKIMEADYANNPSYWNAIDAIKNDNAIYLPVSYVSSAGINVIDRINELIDIIELHDANKEK